MEVSVAEGVRRGRRDDLPQPPSPPQALPGWWVCRTWLGPALPAGELPGRPWALHCLQGGTSCWGQDRGSDLLRCDCGTRGTNNTGFLCLGRTQWLFQTRTFPGEDIPDSSSRTFQYPCADREAVMSPQGWGRAQEMFPQFRTQRTQRPAVCSQWPDEGQRQVVGCCPVSVSLEPGRHGVQRCNPQASVQEWGSDQTLVIHSPHVLAGARLGGSRFHREKHHTKMFLKSPFPETTAVTSSKDNFETARPARSLGRQWFQRR